MPTCENYRRFEGEQCLGGRFEGLFLDCFIPKDRTLRSSEMSGAVYETTSVISYKSFSQHNNKIIMFTVLQRHVSTHTSHVQARTILFYKVTVLILGSQTLTCILHRCYLLHYNWRLLQMSLLRYYTNYSRCIFCMYG
jgi:hypothetical protein